jgi:hypothetical protein
MRKVTDNFNPINCGTPATGYVISAETVEAPVCHSNPTVLNSDAGCYDVQTPIEIQVRDDCISSAGVIIPGEPRQRRTHRDTGTRQRRVATRSQPGLVDRAIGVFRVTKAVLDQSRRSRWCGAWCRRW